MERGVQVPHVRGVGSLAHTARVGGWGVRYRRSQRHHAACHREAFDAEAISGRGDSDPRGRVIIVPRFLSLNDGSKTDSPFSLE